MTLRACARLLTALVLIAGIELAAWPAVPRAAQGAPPSAPLVSIGLTLAGLQERAEETMRQAGAAERAPMVAAALEVVLAINRARHSFHDALAKPAANAPKQVKPALTMLEVAVGRLERGSPGDVEEATNAARQVAAAALLPRRHPEVRAVTPSLVVQHPGTGITPVRLAGSFPQSKDKGYRPYLLVADVAITPAEVGTQELVFDVPHRLLQPPVAAHIGLSTLTVVVPFKTSAFAKKREAEFTLPLGTLPERAGTATLALAQVRKSVEWQSVRTPPTEQSADDGDQRDVLRCGPAVAEGWAVKPDSVRIVIERFRGTPGPGDPGARWWHGAPARLAPAVCVAWTTVAGRPGVAGAVTFHYEYVIEREVAQTEWVAETLPLSWGQTIRRSAGGAWKITFTPFDGVPQELSASGTSTPPYLTVTATADGKLQLQVTPAPELP